MATPVRRDRITTYLAPVGVMVFALVVLDVSLKWLMTNWLGFAADMHAWWVVEGQIGFEYARNTGAAFGLFRGNPELLAVISVVVAFAFCYLILAELQSRMVRIVCAGLILGGAIGNLIERVRHGYVTDFIAVGPWPRFNLADSAITIGVLTFVIAVLFQPEREMDHDQDGVPLEGHGIGHSRDPE